MAGCSANSDGGACVRALAVALVLAAGAAPVSAQSIADFYRRAGLTMYVGSGSGGGFDLYTRVFVNHFEIGRAHV